MAEEGSVNGIKASDSHADLYLAIWLFFQITADHVCLPILVATFLFSRRIKRSPTLVNMCVTWIVAGISSTLLLYSGRQSGPEPSHALCLIQASMLEGTPPMCSLSALAFIYSIWTSMTCLSDDRDLVTIKLGLYTTLIVPYVALSSFALATSLVGIHDLSKVNRARRFFYCSVKNSPLSNTMGIFTAVICLICVWLEALVAIRIFRSWRALRRYECEERGRSFDKQLIVRLFIFSGYLLVALVFSAASVPSLNSVITDLFAASIGMAIFVLFGSQQMFFVPGHFGYELDHARLRKIELTPCSRLIIFRVPIKRLVASRQPLCSPRPRRYEIRVNDVVHRTEPFWMWR